MRLHLVVAAVLAVCTGAASAAELIGQAKIDDLMGQLEKRYAAEGPYFENAERFKEEINRVANARYSHLSGLYWHTDLAAAKRVATAEGKPILSLHLLGRLDEELSCANSRFFRLLLYPDPKIRKLLHDRFVLHWHSVRPVPIITIDLGNSRTIRRTITGNSIHYILLPTGEVMDGIPGLFAPEAFRRDLTAAADGCREILAVPARQRERALLAYQTRVVRDLEARWRTDIAAWAVVAAQPHSVTLACGECPRERSAEIFWRELGTLHPEYQDVSGAAEQLVQNEYVRVRQANGATDIELFIEFNAVKGRATIPPSMVRELLPALAADTVHAEYRLRRDLHELIATFPGYRNVDTLNTDVYARLFRAPLDDPWMGLAPADVFSGLPEDGGLHFGREETAKR